MKYFWEAQSRKRYLFDEIYNIDTAILRFKNWFNIEYDISLERSHCKYYQTGEEEFVEDCISEEEYLSNLDSGYIAYVNYNDLTSRHDYDKICKEFEAIINDAFIYEEQNYFLEFAQDSINQAQTDGQAKTLLQSILKTLDSYSTKQTLLLGNGSLNRIQEVIAEAYSYSYWNTLEFLVRQYDTIYEQITRPYKESQQSIIKPEETKPEKHTQIFAGKSFYLWERLHEHFKLQDSSRADFKFMFEVMKHDGYIHETVSQKAMLNWVNRTYEISIEKPRYENFKKDVKRLAIYSMHKSQHQNLDA